MNAEDPLNCFEYSTENGRMVKPEIPREATIGHTDQYKWKQTELTSHGTVNTEKTPNSGNATALDQHAETYMRRKM